MLYRGVATVVLVLALALTAGLAWFVAGTPDSLYGAEPERHVPAIATSATPVTVTIGKGDSLATIGAALEEKGVIRSRRLFEVMVGVTGAESSLQAGDYDFDPGTPVIEVIDRIVAGKTASRDVLIPEGRRAEEIGDILEKAGVVSKQQFLAALVKSNYHQPFLQQVSGDNLEGYLFPATYQFVRGMDPADVVNAMLDAFQQQVADKVQLEGQNLTLDQVVNLAAIVEREAAVASERPIIASVFLNRLRAGIALDADPTVQFALVTPDGSIDTGAAPAEGYWKSALSLDDLKLDSPYNTYTHQDLPPGPIANPGLDSIQAVVRPASTNYLFFVAKNDGTHVFAETLEEHQRNVNQYQP